jgi:hypothetical protein
MGVEPFLSSGAGTIVPSEAFSPLNKDSAMVAGIYRWATDPTPRKPITACPIARAMVSR